MRKRFALSGVVAFALIGVASALEPFGPISLSQQAPQATQKVTSVRIEGVAAYLSQTLHGHKRGRVGTDRSV